VFFRGSLPLLIYSEGGGLHVKYPMWYNYNNPCGACEQCHAPHALILRDGQPLMVRPIYSHEGIWGLYPHSCRFIFYHWEGTW
jgi:hypothetical protein